MADVELRDTGDLKRLAKVLRQAANGKELRKELTTGIRDEVRPIVAQVKAAYRAGPSRGGSRRGPRLRATLAKATRLEVRTSGRQAGVRIRVDGRKMPDGMKAIQKHYEGVLNWRHPVFGDRDVWVHQQSHPTFYRTVQPNAERIRQRVNEIAADVLRKVEKKA